MHRFEGKVAVVTGAARGQGRSHAIGLAAEGADVILIDNCASIAGLPYEGPSEADLRETAAGVEKYDRRAIVGVVDTRDSAGMKSFMNDAVAQLGGLDIVLANAGICGYGAVLDLTPDAWRDVIDINLTGGFNTAQAAIPHIRDQGRGGAVVFTASICGLRAVPNIGHYNASKFGVIGLMQTLAEELGDHYIRVNAVCPGNVDTIMIQNPGTMKLFLPDLKNPTRADAEAPDSGYRRLNTIPEPYVSVQDITNAVLFLCSEEARFVTGTSLVVDLGRLIKQ